MSKHSILSRRLANVLGLGALFAALATVATAQVAVTGITYKPVVDSPDTTITNFTPGTDFTFSNSVSMIDTVSTSAGDYSFGPAKAATKVYLRRPDSLANYATTVALQANGANSTFSSTLTSVNTLLQSNNAYAGLINPFYNGTGSNVERIDVYFGGSYVVQAGDAMVFFDLNLQAGDTFRIAAFTGWADSAPTAYANTGLLVQSTNFGPTLQTPDGLTNQAYYGATYNTSDALTTAYSVGSIGNRSLTGVLVRFSDLGLNPGDIIKGISLMAGDVNPATAGDLVNYTNTSVYSSSTSSAWGSVDFANFNTVIASPVPEPSTYGMLLTAGSLGFFAWRRRRSARVAAKA